MKSVSTKAWVKAGQEEGKTSTKTVWKRIDPQSQTSAKKHQQLHTWTTADYTRVGRPRFLCADGTALQRVRPHRFKNAVEQSTSSRILFCQSC